MKKYVLGVMTGVLLAMPIYTFADNALPQVTAYLRSDLPILLDGQKLELKNPPLIYDGSTYLPLKETANVLGKEVNWNEKTQTIEMKSNVASSDSINKTDKYSEKIFVSGGDLGEILSGERSGLSLADKSEKQNDTFYEYSVELKSPTMYYSVDLLTSLGIGLSELKSLPKYKVVDGRVIKN